jgi:hypothetical protein
MPETSQSYANHVRLVPPFHYGLLGLFMVNLGWCIYRAVQAPSMDTVMGALMAAGLIVLAVFARGFALTVQDRVIRLEMRLRLRELLPAPLQPRIGEFSRAQMVALRFASDAELPALAEKVLRDNIRDKKTIKQMIKDWQADELRA